MSNIINILVSMESDSIANSNSYSNIESRAPTIDSKYIHMLTYNGTNVIDNGGTKLSLKNVRKDDNIIWKEDSLSPYDSRYSVVLTAVVADNKVVASEYLFQSELVMAQKTVPIITGENPISVTPKEVDYHFWVSSIKAVPTSSVQIPFTCSFEIYEGPVRIGFGKYRHILELVTV
ncbi:AidA/PixA family protein [Xenorhabdus sp. Sc-CR9]|uniref:AidA/PixA family protein n=1 Tax=Xenorhabdus sp. Sc-CR9 TaxID=2584468 RepID=UPI001F28D7F6|nr:AidA/PixA family protein [Xenorhabdus sp. Sc-CR9]